MTPFMKIDQDAMARKGINEMKISFVGDRNYIVDGDFEENLEDYIETLRDKNFEADEEEFRDEGKSNSQRAWDLFIAPIFKNVIK